jgi:hypothetical protein
MWRRRGTVVLAFVLGLVLASVVPAAARTLITGHDIKNHTVTKKDLTRTIDRALARQLLPGPQGIQGIQGIQGVKGDKGAPAVSLFAWVHGAGDIAATQGAVSTTHPSTGAYTITFNQYTANCAPTLSGNSLANVTATWAYGGDSSFSVRVFVAGALADNNWSIVVSCPTT